MEEKTSFVKDSGKVFGLLNFSDKISRSTWRVPLQQWKLYKNRLENEYMRWFSHKISTSGERFPLLKPGLQ